MWMKNLQESWTFYGYHVGKQWCLYIECFFGNGHPFQMELELSWKLAYKWFFQPRNWTKHTHRKNKKILQSHPYNRSLSSIPFLWHTWILKEITWQNMAKVAWFFCSSFVRLWLPLPATQGWDVQNHHASLRGRPTRWTDSTSLV